MLAFSRVNLACLQSRHMIMVMMKRCRTGACSYDTYVVCSVREVNRHAYK